MSTKCVKAFTLEVTDSCGIWNIAWDAPLLTQSAPTPGSVSAVQTACHFTASQTCPEWPGGSGSGTAIQSHGSFTYTGPLVSNHLKIVNTMTNVGPSAFVLLSLTVKVDSVVVLTVFINNLTTFTYDYDFDIPLSVAALIEVDYVTTLLQTAGDPGDATAVYDGAFSVNP